MTTPPHESGSGQGYGEVPVPETPGYVPPPPFAPQPDGTQYGAPPGYPPPGYAAPGYGPPPSYGAPYGPPPGYGQYPPAVYQQGTNGLAIASMVLGILWIYWIGSILALIFGYVARSQIKKQPQSGGGMAVAGIVLGWIGLAFLVVFIVVLVAVRDSDSTFTLLQP